VPDQVWDWLFSRDFTDCPGSDRGWKAAPAIKKTLYFENDRNFSHYQQSL
jgi:hypothetical protein